MYHVVTNEEELLKSVEALKEEKLIACDTETTGLDVTNAELEGIGYGTDKETFFIPFPNDIQVSAIKEALYLLYKGKEIVFHNAKYDLKVFKHNHYPIPESFHDTMIMSWLVDENGQHGLKPLAKEILGVEPKKFTQINRTLDLFRNEANVMQELAEYCMDDVKNTFLLYQHFRPLLEKENVLVDYERIELKLIPVLIDMELRGISIDVSLLQKKQKVAKKELLRLEQDLILLASKKMAPDPKRAINLRSPKQIENILFNVFYYPSVKETKGKSKSTDNEVLETLVKTHDLKENDFVPMLLKYRDLDKIYTTYLIALEEKAGVENVIRSNFMQHGTNTGRISSNDPNLQNIPTRSDNLNVREAFIPRKGYKFLLADYSQIELRVIAHFSRDENMIDTFLDGGDIHAKTMQITKTSRKVAKAINFGLIYGMGPRTLAQTLKIKEEDSKRYMNKFFGGYPQIRFFIDRIQQQALRTGVVTMITGRKRRFHEHKDRRWFNTIARQSVNTIIQGSAADLIKIAMIKLHPVLNKIDAHMLVQVHDELIIEVPEDKIEEARVAIKTAMESALTLRVPLVANITEGDKWIKE